MKELWPWLTLMGLGAYHGINPAMGWLFAVALGMQEKDRRAVIRALPPLALGHAASIAVVVSLLVLARVMVSDLVLQRLCAGVLFAFGLYRLLRFRHPRWVGMRVDFKDLTVWSFLMASAHGAGLMLAPILLKWPNAQHVHHHMPGPSPSNVITGSAGVWFAAVGIHTISLFLVTGTVALLVYEKLGLSLLRQAWFNLDLLWVLALLGAGALALLL